MTVPIWHLEENDHTLHEGGRSVYLTKSEWLFLSALFKSRGRTVTFDTIASYVWAYPRDEPKNPQVSMRQIVRRLRDKLQDAGFTDPVQPVRSLGYRLDLTPGQR